MPGFRPWKGVPHLNCPVTWGVIFKSVFKMKNPRLGKVEWFAHWKAMKGCRWEPKVWDGETSVHLPVGPTAFSRATEVSFCSLFQILHMKNIVPGPSLAVQWLKSLPSSPGDVSSIPGWGAKIPHVWWPKKQNMKQKQYCNRFNKDSKKIKILKKEKHCTFRNPFPSHDTFCSGGNVL